MRLLILALTFLLVPALNLAQSRTTQPVPPLTGESPIIAIPWGDSGITSYWTPDTQETRVYQLTPGQSFWSNDRGEFGYIYNNFSRSTLEPSEPREYLPPRSDRSDHWRR